MSVTRHWFMRFLCNKNFFNNIIIINGFPNLAYTNFYPTLIIIWKWEIHCEAVCNLYCFMIILGLELQLLPCLKFESSYLVWNLNLIRWCVFLLNGKKIGEIKAEDWWEQKWFLDYFWFWQRRKGIWVSFYSIFVTTSWESS